jgi:hypothetical protein
MTKIIIELPPEQGHALAQFVKRTGFDDCQRLGSRHDGGVEAEEMWAAIQKLQSALKASTRDDDEKADPHPGAGFSSRSDTPYTVPCTRISATQRAAVRCPSWKG